MLSRSTSFWISLIFALSTIPWSGCEDSVDETCARTHIESPRTGFWHFRVAQFSGTIATASREEEQDYNFVVRLDGNQIASGSSHMDPNSLDSDIQFAFPPISYGPHTVTFEARAASNPNVVLRTTSSFHCVQPPHVLLSFPVDGQRFVCVDSKLVMIFLLETDFELDAEFFERGAGFLGAAAILNNQRGAITIEGWVIVEGIGAGAHTLRVALFDHSAREIPGSSSKTISFTVDAAPLEAGIDAAAISAQECLVVWAPPQLPGKQAVVQRMLLSAAKRAGPDEDSESPKQHRRQKALSDDVRVDTTSAHGIEDGVKGGEGRLEGSEIDATSTLNCHPVTISAETATPPQATLFQVQSPVAFKLYLPASDLCDVCSDVRKQGVWQPVQSFLMLSLISTALASIPNGAPRPTVVDVGANIGWFTLLARAMDCRVIAFEPQISGKSGMELAGTSLVASLGANGAHFAEGVTAYGCGVGEVAGQGAIYRHGATWGLVGLKALEDGDRAMVRLTDVVQGRVAVMKVDIEGGELELIRGWDERALVVDHVLTEVKEFNHLVVLQLMQQRGYQCRWFKESYISRPSDIKRWRVSPDPTALLYANDRTGLTRIQSASMPGVPACLGVFYPQSRVRLTSRSGCLRWISGAGGRPRRSRSACHGHRSHRAMSGPFGPNRREQAGGHRRVLVRSRFLDVSNASRRDNHGHLDPRFGARDQLLLCRSVVWVRGVICNFHPCRHVDPFCRLSEIGDQLS